MKPRQGGKQSPDSAPILKVEPRDFADELCLGCVRERGAREDPKDFDLKKKKNQYENGRVAIY